MYKTKATGRFRLWIQAILVLLAFLPGPWGAESKGEDTDARLSRDMVRATLKPTQNWPQPPPGPPGLPDRTIAFIGEDLRNSGILGVAAGVKEAARTMGWQVLFFDIRTKEEQRETIFKKVLELRPDGVVLGGMDAVGNVDFIAPLDAVGIPVVGWHVAPDPGPVANTPVRLNVATDSTQVAKAAADYMITEAHGRAGVVIFTDSRFAIAKRKAGIMADAIRGSGCRLLEIVDLPLDKTGDMMPAQTKRLLRDYGKSWQYSLAINDLYFDHASATLVMNGNPPEGPPSNISAGDGSPSALLRIRYASYQKATVPEPLIFHGWQLVDELNRIMQGKPLSGYLTPPIILSGKNIWPQDDKIDLFDPANQYRLAYQKIWKRNSTK